MIWVDNYEFDTVELGVGYFKSELDSESIKFDRLHRAQAFSVVFTCMYYRGSSASRRSRGLLAFRRGSLTPCLPLLGYNGAMLYILMLYNDSSMSAYSVNSLICVMQIQSLHCSAFNVRPSDSVIFSTSMPNNMLNIYFKK